MRVFAKIGSTQQILSDNDVDDYIEMQTERPDGQYRAKSDGTWELFTPVPGSVSPRQIRQALTQMNLRYAVETAIAAGDQDLKDWWEFATTFERDHPIVLSMAQSLGITSSQIDELFIYADSI